MAAKTGRARALEAIVAERDRQTATNRDDRDDGHRPAEWVVLLCRYIAHAGDAGWNDDAEEYRHSLVQVGAVALAAIESLDRAAERAGDD